MKNTMELFSKYKNRSAYSPGITQCACITHLQGKIKSWYLSNIDLEVLILRTVRHGKTGNTHFSDMWI